MNDRVEVAIVGAGTAGLAALREVRRHTDDFVLIDAPPHGTTCARVGCMPSKALIAAANAYHARTRLDAFGIAGGDALTPDIPAVLARVRALRDDFVAGVLKATDDLGDRRIVGRARLDGPNALIVDGRRIKARRIVLAPGSSPVMPDPWTALGDRVLTTDTLFEQRDLPRRIGVIGLGAVGIEMAQALARLGLTVHAFNKRDRIGGLTDPQVSDALRDALGAEFAIHLGADVTLAETDGGIDMRWPGGTVTVDRVLAAVGRRPSIAGLGLETLDVPLDDRGMPPVDPHTMRIADTPVHLAGDANGIDAVLHESADDGHIAGLNAIQSGPLRLRRRTPLTIGFCDPQTATIGRRAADLDAGRLTGEVDFANQGRARMMQQNYGLLRIYAEPDTGRLLGAEMAAPEGEHLAHILALALDRGLTVADMLRMPFYHPTLEEGMRTALRQIAKQLPPAEASDLSACGPLGASALD
ncbi:hypothetical protein OCGS_2703 [Oceaniovalibus guishaninsula JLT2003]|uniref:Dihydrolipoyl dehydrogenase n=1 Tax=Oceaniovalibus guishaninsula JLT2003 TaxID=1231392 RepID=K2H943_9RHOB|nr:dihydrolipoyl dehydrogenase [Oceaniovalibus guishaninsula]EKE43112.1 hypothetical protein OCGS_2703 [Oceaniovalibus guishaninsula JLT2003]